MTDPRQILDDRSLIQPNLNAFLSSMDVHTIVKGLCKKLQAHSYVTIGSFLKHLSDEELDELCTFADAVREFASDDDAKHMSAHQLLAYQTLSAITLLLLTAESTVLVTEDVLMQSCDITVTFIALEWLYRQGKIELMHDNLAYGDMDDAVIAKTLKGVSYDDSTD